MRLSWLWTLFVSWELAHSLFQIWKTAAERGTSDDELLVAFQEGRNSWSSKLQGIKLLMSGGFFLFLQLQIGRNLEGCLLSLSILLSAIRLMIVIPPSVGIHKSGLFLKTGWLKWDAVHRYRWKKSSTLEINPGFFSLSYQKLEIPEEFTADVQAMLDSQCPNCEIETS